MEFKNVTVIKEANVYFDGKVTSRTVLFESGEKKTLGFMLAGEYEFNTDAEEIMEVLGGDMSVMLAGRSGIHTLQQRPKLCRSGKLILQDDRREICGLLLFIQKRLNLKRKVFNNCATVKANQLILTK